MNFRLSFCLAVTMIVSIILATNVFISQKVRLALIFSFSILSLAGLVLFFITKKKFILPISVCLIFAVFSFSSIYFKANNLDKNKSLNVENCLISGKIYKVNKNLEKNKIYIYIDDVHLITENDAEKFNGDFFISLNLNSVDTSKLTNGKYITVYCNPKLFSLEEKNDRKNLTFLSNNVAGTCYIYSYNMLIENRSSVQFKDKIKSQVLEYFNQTDMFYSGAGYAMLFGDSTVLNTAVSDVFYDSGIAHLLAVSGFHISIIVVFLGFIFDKLKLNKYIKLGLIAVILLLYAYICNFSPSVIRASIMSLLALYATNRNKEYDSLSALSLACCIILLINPLDLFSMSFVLSFVSVLSIILLMPLLNRLLSKVFYNKLASMLSLSLSTTIGVSVFQLYYTSSMPLLSVIANLVTVPIVSVLFIYLIVAVIFGSLFKIAVPLIKLFEIGMKYILQFNSILASVNLSISVSNIREIALLLSLTTIFVMSDYVFLKKKAKWIISSLLVCGVVCLVIFWCKMD